VNSRCAPQVRERPVTHYGGQGSREFHGPLPRPAQIDARVDAVACTMERLSPGLLAIAFIASSLSSDAAAQMTADSVRRPFEVTHYSVRVEPNISEKTIKGIVILDLVVTADHQSTIELDSGDLTIDAVKERGALIAFAVQDHRLTVRWPRPARVKEPRQLEVEYHGAPRSGMHFFSERPQVYTVFSTSQWMVCVDAPDDRATLNLTVILPAALTIVANGTLVGRHVLTNGTVAHEWRQDRPMPSHTFGFAAGRFTDVTESRKGRRFRYLGSDFSAAELRRIFADSADMMRFFENRAGVPYRDGAYTQALVANTAGQEMSAFSVMSEDYGRAVLSDPRTESLVAHELAHQWWGNSVTCGAWTHMWLNEGFATFMAAAFMEQRFGRDEYLRTVEAWHSRYSNVRDAGHDRSLVFSEWNHPTADDRALVYQKGAYVLHLLRETLGDAAFWTGIRDYTRRYAGTSVTTGEFEHALERSTGKDLSTFFNTWVY
jgi:aminopeptidase N